MIENNKLGSSFRDPKGFVYQTTEGKIRRQISISAKEDFDFFIKSGLYKELTSKELLIKHKEVKFQETQDFYKIIEPQQIPFISYPYEWSFSQFKDAALLTLKIQKIALEYGMSLKDASAYNVQFLNGKPIFIDTLSFEKRQSETPWVAYKQFCQHFLAPLALMSKTDIRLGKLMQLFIDGVDLELASNILPVKTKLSLGLMVHIHLHAGSQKKYSETREKKKDIKFSNRSLFALIDNLYSTVSSLNWKPEGTEWGDYYNNTNYNKSAFKNKSLIIEDFLKTIKPKSVWDLGANNGEFSRIASKKGIPTLAFDIDPAAVEICYQILKKKKETTILPLISDLTAPSPSIGWNNQERLSIAERGQADCLFALALIHHLSISNNVPFEKLAEFFTKLGKNLVVEFIPKTDSQVQKLLSTREDIFPNYNETHFEKDFSKYFKILSKKQVKGSLRTLYLMKSIQK